MLINNFVALVIDLNNAIIDFDYSNFEVDLEEWRMKIYKREESNSRLLQKQPAVLLLIANGVGTNYIALVVEFYVADRNARAT